MTIIQNIRDKKSRAIEIRKYTDNELALANEWLKNNKPKKVGLDMDINKYSMIVTKTQSKAGADNRNGSSG